MDPVRKLDRSVKGRAVLITGAASGMGRATANVFAAEGAMVAITDINEAGLARVLDEIKFDGGNAHAWRLDVFNHDDIKRVVNEVARHFGRLDILINNAGFSAFHPIDSNSYDEAWDCNQRAAHRATAAHSRGLAPPTAESDARESSTSRPPRESGQRRAIAPMSSRKRG